MSSTSCKLEGGSVSTDFVISNKQIFFVFVNLINHVLVLGTVAYLCWYCILGNANGGLTNVTNRHAFLLTLGYVLLMSEAISVLVGESTITFCLSRRANSHLHWLLQMIGGCLCFYGVIDLYLARTRHFKSIHSILGIISLAVIGLVFLSGLSALCAARLRKKVKPVLGKFAHNSLGIFCFVMGMAAQIAAYQKKWLKRSQGDTVAYILTVTTVLITLLSLLSALRQLWQQFKGIVRIIKT